MRMFMAVVAITAVILGMTGATRQVGEVPKVEVAQAHHRPGGKELRNGCHRLYPVKRVHGYMRDRYRQRERPLTTGQKRYIKKMQGCMFSHKKAQRARQLQRRLRVDLRKRLVVVRVLRRIAATTPYGPCYGGTWAVPCEIIDGESDGSWTAVNGGGCVGPYQFCGWSIPWPVLSGTRVQILRKMLAHHRQAAYLWNGGAGCSNWKQTSSQC